jgi:protein-L-isoaspartate(D-aspartate) O-methyltransferase
MVRLSGSEAMSQTSVQRRNMVENQVRPSDVTDERILQAMLEIPREAFAPPELTSLAYMDASLPVTSGQDPQRFLLSPRTFAKLVQLVAVLPRAIVLDVACATGYSTAVLAKLARRVVGLEVDAALAERAVATLASLGIREAQIVQGPLRAGSPSHGPFDVILLNGCVPEVPQGLLEQLNDGGRLAAMIGEDAYGRAQIWRRSGKAWGRTADFDAAAEPLPGFERPQQFVF